MNNHDDMMNNIDRVAPIDGLIEFTADQLEELIDDTQRDIDGAIDGVFGLLSCASAISYVRETSWLMAVRDRYQEALEIVEGN